MSSRGPSVVHHHAVQFYGSEESLFTTVAGFLSQGLIDHQPAVIIATPDHRTAILEHLAARLIDVGQAQATGGLVVLDARATLARFMVEGMPDSDAFDASVGVLISRLVKEHRAGTLIRAYGEMVDLLWKDGRAEAAVRLEVLWNRLAARHGFALLCGYAMGNFDKQTDLFEQVCAQHTHVMPGGTPLTVPSNTTVQ